MNIIPEINTIQNLRDAFLQIQEEHKVLKHFLFGNYADLIANARSNLKYPCLMLEEPNIQFLDNGADYRRRVFQFAIIVLIDLGKNPNKKLELQEICADAIEDICARLDYESRTYHQFHYRLDGDVAELVEPIGADNLIGYRLEMNIERVGGVEFDETKWN